MKRIAEFYKVSFSQFEKDYKEINPNSKLSHAELKAMYDNIKLPTRATTGSAGYDFFLPHEINLKAGEQIVIPTGIRFECKQDYALFMFSKSGLGNRNRLQLNTAVSIIDSDYFYSDNEGHIIACLIHDSRNPKDVLSLPAGKGYFQGVFIKYGITKSDKSTGKRNGGLGSTNQ